MGTSKKSSFAKPSAPLAVIANLGPDDSVYRRLETAKRLRGASGVSHRVVLAADGGIRENTVPRLRADGAETVVLGSLAFKAKDLSARMKWLQTL